jgi:alanine racemase
MKVSSSLDMRTWVEVSKSSIASNYKNLKKYAGKTPLLVVIKSNAYGHGIVEFGKEIEKQNPAYFGVYEFSEAMMLRKAGIKTKILVLGWTSPEDFAECAKKNIEITISNFEKLKALQNYSQNKPRSNSSGQVNFHLKVDTGLGRQGFLPEDMPKVLKELSKIKNAQLVGLYTHFAIAEDPKHIDYTRAQVEKVLVWKDALSAEGYSFVTHAGASSGLMQGSELHLDMVRAGIAVYGLWPSEEMREYINSPASLKLRRTTELRLTPSLSWKTKVSEIKKVPAGSKISYDLTEEVKRDSVLAVLPVGYWDGYPRALSSKGEVLIKGQRAKVIGRVCMNMCVVDVTDIKGLPAPASPAGRGRQGVKAGDVVVLIGKQGDDRVSAEELAERAGTINYEIVTRINPQIQRIYK